MAEKYSFFNSVNGDRKYSADDWSNYFSQFLTNGFFSKVASNLQVLGNNGNMTTIVKAGAAWINGYMYQNTSDLVLTHDVADGVLDRIDRIVVQLDYVNRLMKTVIKKGTFSSTPAAPSLQRDANIYEISLADVYISKGTTSILQASITDNRLNTSLCGMVNSLITVDTTTVTAQMQSDFNTWFNNIKGQLAGDIAANLQNQINTHLAEKATVNKVSHVKPDGITTVVDGNGAISATPQVGATLFLYNNAWGGF
jgi:hypothetical protein